MIWLAEPSNVFKVSFSNAIQRTPGNIVNVWALEWRFHYTLIATPHRKKFRNIKNEHSCWKLSECLYRIISRSLSFYMLLNADWSTWNHLGKNYKCNTKERSNKTLLDAYKYLKSPFFSQSCKRNDAISVMLLNKTDHFMEPAEEKIKIKQ